MKNLTTEDTEDTERATPETDAKASNIIGFFSCATVPADFARKLERERDEARKQIAVVRSMLDAVILDAEGDVLAAMDLCRELKFIKHSAQ